VDKILKKLVLSKIHGKNFYRPDSIELDSVVHILQSASFILL